jgi:hypothetical protein
MKPGIGPGRQNSMVKAIAVIQVLFDHFCKVIKLE